MFVKANAQVRHAKKANHTCKPKGVQKSKATDMGSLTLLWRMRRKLVYVTAYTRVVARQFRQVIQCRRALDLPIHVRFP